MHLCCLITRAADTNSAENVKKRTEEHYALFITANTRRAAALPEIKRKSKCFNKEQR